MQKTLVLLKPDAVERGLVGEIISRLERKGLRFAAIKLMRVTEELANRHYAEHLGKAFFEGLVEFITSGPVVAMVLEGENAVTVVRGIMGATNPQNAVPGTVRGDLGMTVGPNLVHGSDSEESATREISLFFSPEDIQDYERGIDAWITGA